jgi:NAD-dependent isocitrate dehydrogenase
MQQVVLIKGDGIGPEISDAVRVVFEASGAPIEWVLLDELKGITHTDNIEIIKKCGVALKGPTTTPSGGGQRSLNVELRKKLGLFANVRPIKSLPAIKSRYQDVDMIVVRENIEDTYSGIEYALSSSVAAGIKLMTARGSERCIRYAFELARSLGRRKVTCIHKANIHKMTDGLFLNCFNRIRQEYPEVESNDALVDATCMHLVRESGDFDLMVMQNLYGDIISDLCAGLVGGLGVAPAGNIGSKAAVFEAVHGSAPDIAGKGVANPTALLLSSTMMLRHLGLGAWANFIEEGLIKTLSIGQTTADLGGDLSTDDFARAICKSLSESPTPKRALSSSPESRVKSVLRQSCGIPSTASINGLDVYIISDTRPTPPVDIGLFKLCSIMNRGIDVCDIFDEDDLTDVYCLRYKSAGQLTPEKCNNLLQELTAKGLDWISCQKLFT